MGINNKDRNSHFRSKAQLGLFVKNSCWHGMVIMVLCALREHHLYFSIVSFE